MIAGPYIDLTDEMKLLLAQERADTLAKVVAWLEKEATVDKVRTHRDIRQRRVRELIVTLKFNPQVIDQDKP